MIDHPTQRCRCGLEFDAMMAGHCPRCGSVLGVMTSTNVFPPCDDGKPVSLEKIKQAMAEFATIDFAVRIRVPPHVFHRLRRLPLAVPGLFGEPANFPSSLAGLRCEEDWELHPFEAEVDYRSGRIEKLDLRPKLTKEVTNAD